MRYGMRTLLRTALLTLCALSVVFVGVALATGGQPPLWLFMAYLMPSFFCIGILFGNMNALAMEPLGHIAGVGAAVVGSLSTLVATPLGAGIGQAYNGTVTPLALGFAVFGLGALALMRWGRKARGERAPQRLPAGGLSACRSIPVSAKSALSSALLQTGRRNHATRIICATISGYHPT